MEAATVRQRTDAPGALAQREPPFRETTMTSLLRAATTAIGVLFGAAVMVPCAQAQSAPSRGELLYSTHCITCHSAQIHWRDKKAATDWTSLQLQVRRWQGAADLGWTDSDILDVARYLNDSIYRYPQTPDWSSLIVPSNREVPARRADGVPSATVAVGRARSPAVATQPD
jgi:mono/diheme cytochrome c family protein